MADIKFGLQYFNKETPIIINRVKSALNYFTGSAVIFLPQIAEKLHTTVETISVSLGVALVAINSIGILFGVPPEATVQATVTTPQPSNSTIVTTTIKP